jgi:hypothetical protein
LVPTSPIKADYTTDKRSGDSKHHARRSDSQLPFTLDHELGQENEERARQHANDHSHYASTEPGRHRTLSPPFPA